MTSLTYQVKKDTHSKKDHSQSSTRMMLRGDDNTVGFDAAEQIRKNKTALFSYAVTLTRNLNDAEDLYQDMTFLILKNKDKFMAGTNFVGWAKTIMRNKYINQIRKKKRYQIALASSNHCFFFNQKTQYSKEADLVLQDVYKHLFDSIADNYRIPFFMHFVGYSYKEIAEYLKVPIGTIKSRIFNARQLLKEAYHKLDRQ